MKNIEDMTDAEYYKWLDDEEVEAQSVLIQFMIDFDALIPVLELTTCVACNGSGFYDHNGSPRCGGCNGTGSHLKEYEETVNHIMWKIIDDEKMHKYYKEKLASIS